MERSATSRLMSIDQFLGRALVLAAALAGLSPARAEEPATSRTFEWKLLPVIGGNTDIGLELGALTVISGIGAPDLPYRWQLVAQLAASMKLEGGAIDFPVQDHFLTLDWLDVPGRRFRFSFNATYMRATNAGYYGLGNASRIEPGLSTRYRRHDGGLSATARWAAWRNLRLLGGIAGKFFSSDAYPGSRLAADLLAGEPLLTGTSPFATAQIAAGVEWDSRDNEMDPRHGVWADASARATPSFLSGLHQSYGGANATARVYQSIFGDRLIVAARVIGDVLFGQPPLNELAHAGGFSGTWFLGGSDGVRGVPEGRYEGRIRLIANLEARSPMLARTRFFGERLELGALAFFDAGRVWADWRPRPELDGEGLGLHWGVGGGLRVRWGEAFVGRLDIAYSPDAAAGGLPIGIYTEVGQVF